MKRWILIVVALVLIGGLIVWRFHVNAINAAALAPANPKNHGPISVRAAKAVSRDIVKTFEATANIESPQTVKITPKLTALIDSVNVHEGDHVTAGQVLVLLDQSEPAAAVRKNEATVAEAKARLVQARVTQNQVNVGVGTNIQQMAAALNSAQSDYNQTKQNYAATIAAAHSAVVDAQGRVDSALAAEVNANAVIRSSQANLTDATTKLTRLESLYKQNFIAAQDVDDQRATVSVQQGSLDVSNAQLNTAKASLASANAQKDAAQQQESIAVTKGQADIEAAQARLDQAKAALVNAQANTAQRPAYVANLQALEATVLSAQADLVNAQVVLQQTVLRSPVDGYVTSRLMDPGSMGALGSPIVEIQTIKQVWANIPVPEEQIASVQEGMPASMQVDALPGKTFSGKVVQINPSADPSSRQFTVRVAIDNASGLLKPGMFARVSFVLQKITDATTVPPEAIQADTDGSSYVWQVNANDDHTKFTVSKQTVTLGASDDQGVQVLSGIDPGTRVVTMYTGHLVDGSEVRTGKKGQGAVAGAPGAPAADGAAPGNTPTGAPAAAGEAPAASGTPGEAPAGGHKGHHGKHKHGGGDLPAAAATP